MSADTSDPPRRISLLRYIVSWCIYFGMRVIVLFPLRWQIAFGKTVGLGFYLVFASRRRVVRNNLAVCFPALSEQALSNLVRRHFAALGASLVERAMGWFGSVEKIRRVVAVEGENHLREALAAGHGVVLMTFHFTTIELFNPIIAELSPHLCGMYKRLKNPLMDRLVLRGRLRSFDALFPKDDLRQMIGHLRHNSTVWYAPDQSFARKGSALIPFFGEPAMTNTAISRIARSTGATVLPLLCRRLDGDRGYEMRIHPPLDRFPSEDGVADMRRFVAVFEDYIRQCPEQYWWVHQRFKGRPDRYADLYE
jgi:KDO2-lipid IV(A) lauroyltransferase